MSKHGNDFLILIKLIFYQENFLKGIPYTYETYPRMIL